jgi:hypothetical protein
MPPLDRWLPEFDFVERHERGVAATPERALDAVLAVPAASDRVVRWLLRLRGIRASTTIAELPAGLGFAELERRATSIVAGGCGTPWRPRGGTRPFADAAPGTVRMAIAFWAEPAPVGSVLATETRVAAIDVRARRSFARYWRLIRPFSGLIRRRWLRAGARRASG